MFKELNSWMQGIEIGEDGSSRKSLKQEVKAGSVNGGIKVKLPKGLHLQSRSRGKLRNDSE